MFDELTEELLDLSVDVRGYGAATYAAVADEPCSSGGGLCCTFIVCCTCTSLCW